MKLLVYFRARNAILVIQGKLPEEEKCRRVTYFHLLTTNCNNLGGKFALLAKGTLVGNRTNRFQQVRAPTSSKR